jgi:predicted membrane channel-forming protein YqfA (hemolysin III family)
MPKHVKLATIDQVSFEFREDYILTGYRKPNTDFKSCIQSIFYLNNETINFWTHFIPFLFILFELLNLCFKFNIMQDYFVWPLFIYLLTVCFYLLMSSIAHMFNCLSSTARHLCFILDYLSISIYGVGSSIVYHEYTIRTTLNQQMHTNHILFDRYIWLVMFLTLISNVVSCSTRFILSKSKRGLLRAGSFIFQYLFVNIPLLYRFLLFYYPSILISHNYLFSFLSSSSSPLLHNKYNESKTEIIYYFKNESDIFYLAQFISALLAAILYVSHFPESIFPGRFDMIGSSHQIFHLAAFSTTWFQFKAIESDINQLNQYNKSSENLFINSNDLMLQYSRDYLNIYQVDYTSILLLSFFFNALILVYYYFKACYFNPWLLITNQTEQLNLIKKKYN